MRCLTTGSGGFIAGHLTKALLHQGHYVRAVDVKPLPLWHQVNSIAENLCLDLHDFDNCRRASESMDVVFNLAANMGGIGTITSDHVGCMRNSVLNENMLRAAYRAGVDRFLLSSSACVYRASRQSDTEQPALKECDAFPAEPERGYGEDKWFSERQCQEYWRDFGLKTFIPRFHNVMGTYGTWFGGREKAPAAICRKVIEAKDTGSGVIDIWGDGSQARSYMWIGDCITGIQKIVECDKLIATPVNLGSSEMVSVNQLVSMVEDIAGVKLERRYQLDAPKGVAGRNSDNTFIQETLGWQPSTALRVGLEKTYHWILEQYTARKAGKRVIQ